jgi:hypothetical protein
MSYLEQILQGAQQRGGLTDEEFSSIFQQFMPQQQTQPNLGMPQQPVQQIQRQTPIQQTQMPMTWGTGLNTASFGKNSGVTPDPTFGLYDRYKTAKRHDTNFLSEQTGMLAEQDKGMYDDEEDKKGLFSMDWFK